MRKKTGHAVHSGPPQEDARIRVTWPPPPPPGETELEKALRIEEEARAAKSSAEIDEAIERSRLESQKHRRKIRILLLGQAESGKSTILKNFQLRFAPKTFEEEIRAWRAVIHLNLVCSVNSILGRIRGPSNEGRGASSSGLDPDAHTIEPDDKLRMIRLQLGPIREVENILSKRLSADRTPLRRSPTTYPDVVDGQGSEVAVRSGSGWKSLLGLHLHASGPEQLERAYRVIEACKESIVSMWNHPAVQLAVQQKTIVLPEHAAFFLSDAVRVASPDYEPTMEDIFRARLVTVGVEEHHLVVETDDPVKEYVIYDVGGSRSQRAVWASYFDDVNVIIFLAPISAFDQFLSEDGTINRLLDSFQIWRTICSSKLLENITVILLLNKCDLLAEKLESGILFSNFVKSYKNQPNDMKHVARYLKSKFSAIHRQFSPNRQLYTHTTCAIDIAATSLVITHIRDVLLRINLMKTDLL